MQKKLLLLSAKYADIPFVYAARGMGYHVITTGNKSAQPAHQHANEYIPFNYMDYDGMVNLGRELGIDAVCQGCTDACAITAAYLGEKLNLKGHDSLENTLIIHHKDKFKQFTSEYGIRSPKAKWFLDETKALAMQDVSLPVIVKPADLGGGQGISVAYSREQYKKAVKEAFKKSIIGSVVVEKFIKGTLHSMSTFLVNQKVVAYGTANDYSYLNPYLTNTGIFPAEGYATACEILIPEVERIAEILGLVDGLLHFQYIVDKNNIPWIIEMMRRSPGNNFLAALSNSVGLNWYDWIVRAEVGKNSYLIPHSRCPQGYFGYHSIMGEKNGIFSKIEIDSAFEKYVFQVDMFMESGHQITDYMNEKVGNIQYHFPDKEKRDYFIEKINALTRVVYS